MWVSHIVIAILFLLLGIVFMRGKGAFLIAGYNTLSKKEKAKYDEKELCKFMGKSMFALAFSIFLWGLSDLVNIPILFNIGLTLFIGTIIFIIIYGNTQNRFKKESK